MLGVFSGLRPGTSLAAVLALLRTPIPRRSLLVFTVAGLASTWAIGMLVVSVLHGAGTSGGSTFTAVLEVAAGAAALGYATGLSRGWVRPPHRRTSSRTTPGMGARLGRRLRDPSARVVAAAGVATHAPGLIYLVALNAISAGQPSVAGAGAEVAVYDVLWFMVPLASLALVIVRPGVAVAYFETGTAWVRRHEHGVLVAGLAAIGAYLLVKGAVQLLSA